MPTMPTLPLPATAPRSSHRSDGEQSRERLLKSALRLFAEKGYSKTSTREIADAAQANIAAISYYFGDKAGLYRAAFFEPLCSGVGQSKRLDTSGLPLHDALQVFFAEFLEPLKQGETVRQCMRLHYREMVEPTGLWAEEIDNDLKPCHAVVMSVLCRHFGLRKADDDLHRLGFAIVGLGLHMFVGREVMEAIRPSLTATPQAIDAWAQRLVGYAEAMIDAEQRRRSASATPARKKP